VLLGKGSRELNWYLSIAEIQRDLDAFMTHYNQERSRQRYRLNGRTPAQALKEALGLSELPNLRFETRAPANPDTASTVQEEVTAHTKAAQTGITPEDLGVGELPNLYTLTTLFQLCV
jgi:hypothetical protein